MSPRVHIVQAIVSGAVLYPFIGSNAIPFSLAVVLIDIDHFIEYLVDTGDFTLRGIPVFYNILLKNLDRNYLGLSLFHTVEFYIAELIIAAWLPVFYYILAGSLFHHLFDLVSLVRSGHPFAKAFSITDYLVRRKWHPTSIREILSHEMVDTEGIDDIEYWRTRWLAS